MKRLLYFLSCFLLFTLVLTSCSTTLQNKKDEEQSSNNYAVFLRVLDGDTFVANYRNKIQRIRLADIDCFEIVENNRLKTQAKVRNISKSQALKKGKESEKKLAEILMRNNVIYILPLRHDNYGRLIAYVYAGDLNVNQYMHYEGGCYAFPDKSLHK